MANNLKCCNHNCNQGRDCEIRKQQQYHDAILLLVLFVVFLVAVSGFFDVLWEN